jgi:FkbM family methyltransferase
MKFVSHAQNFEDVMLWRALQHVGAGFYIDVGAAWPDEDSVTKAFYDRGWRGINVEPNPKLHKVLEQQRPRDQNLAVAVSDHEGTARFHSMSGAGLSTLDSTIAQGHQEAGWTVADEFQVQLTTLAKLVAQHVPAGQDIHFLKVDVEGFEEAALRGNDWTAVRPWIVLVEATLPLTRTESHAGWEPLLLGADYSFVYADGLNRFYVAKEHAELIPAFQFPPNMFDNFVMRRHWLAETRLKELEDWAKQAEHAAATATERLAKLLASAVWRMRALAGSLRQRKA